MAHFIASTLKNNLSIQPFKEKTNPTQNLFKPNDLVTGKTQSLKRPFTEFSKEPRFTKCLTRFFEAMFIDFVALTHDLFKS